MFLTGDGMRGGPLHRHIFGAPLIGERQTAPCYRFYSVRDEFPALCPVSEGGRAILGELYDVPMGLLRELLEREPPELELSVVELAAGTSAAGPRLAEQGDRPVLAPTLAACGKLAMGITMGYMLLLTL